MSTHPFSAPLFTSAKRLSACVAISALAGSATLVSLAGPAAAASRTPAKVTAVLTEYHIALSKKSFSPGSYLFVAQNKGHEEHALAITGPGLSNKRTALLSPGKSANLTVTLRKGNYDIFCPVPGHKGLGMNVNISVKVGGSTTSGATSSSTTKKGSSGGGYGY